MRRDTITVQGFLLECFLHEGYVLLYWRGVGGRGGGKSTFSKIFERIILQEAINTLAENNFFEGKSAYAYQKNKNTPQALFPLIEQMSEATSSGKNGIVVMADGEGAFDAVWRDKAIYKLYEAGIRNNMFSVFDSFLCDRLLRKIL